MSRGEAVFYLLEDVAHFVWAVLGLVFTATVLIRWTRERLGK